MWLRSSSDSTPVGEGGGTAEEQPAPAVHELGVTGACNWCDWCNMCCGGAYAGSCAGQQLISRAASHMCCSSAHDAERLPF